MIITLYLLSCPSLHTPTPYPLPSLRPSLKCSILDFPHFPFFAQFAPRSLPPSPPSLGQDRTGTHAFHTSPIPKFLLNDHLYTHPLISPPSSLPLSLLPSSFPSFSPHLLALSLPLWVPRGQDNMCNGCLWTS